MRKISTEVGSAYLLVTPKLSNDAGTKLAAGGATSGASYGGKFSNAAKGAISAGAVAMGNILASAATTAAANLGQVFTDMFQGAMDFEQLAGGVEKIFDQADIAGIMNDANAAYKDLNMSANEYLAAINQTGAAFAQTMGDQKGYDTARTGMKAIADYASGTGRNIDELNEKFSLITRSTSSYQSIADQFSGILPATSKDFLEQAQAAGFLSDSYKSLTDVPIAEYQEAVSKMLEKGVADMGLAGNTAMESAETMSGSLAMLKSSWSNFLAGILNDDADLSAYFGALLESIGAVVSNFAPKIGLLFVRLFQQLPQAIYDAIMALPDTMLPALQAVFGEQMGQAISDDMRGALEGIQGAITELFDGIMSAVMPIAENLMSLFQEVWPIISQIVGDAMTFIGGIIETVWPVVSEIIVGAMTTISGIIQDNWPAIQEIVISVMTAIQGFLETVWPAIQNLVTTVMAAIDAVVTTAWPIIQTVVSTVMSAILTVVQTVWPAIQGIISTVVGAITGIINGLSSIVGVVTGIFNGVKQAITDPIGTAKQVVTDAINAIKNIINNAHLRLPHFALPHFVIDGGEIPWGIGGEGRKPTIDVQWYARGGIVDGATLIGAGEAGPEMILPKSGGLMTDFAEEVARQENDEELIRWLSRNLGAIIANNAPTISRRDFDRMARSAIA